jgi:hypothetical protein
LLKAGAALIDTGKIVRAKSKFKAEPEGVGIGSAVYPICIVSEDRGWGAEAVASALCRTELDKARADEIL